MSHAGECVPEEKLVAYLEGKLSPDEYTWVDAHLNRCANCHQTVDWITEHLLQDGSRDSLLFPSTLEYGSGGRQATSDTSDPGQDLVPKILARSDSRESLGKLNDYEVLQILGRGGYGIVFEAVDQVLNRHVAIKVLLPDLATQPISRRRFIREARAGAAINHPNVVTIHGVEESDRVPFLVMELLRGKSLRERLHVEPKLDPLEIIRISIQVAQGLAAAHAQGIVHRDVKPGNIMLVDGLNRVKITDFGLARVVVDKMELTIRGMALGTPGYMSPEQVRGQELDTRSDLFSLGCVIHAMFTGHSPFHGRTVLEIARRVDSEDPPRLRDLDPTVPEFMEELVYRLLRKDPDERYQSAAEVADVLSRHLAILNQTPTDRLPMAWGKPIESSGKKARPRAWRWWAGGGAVAAAVAGVLLFHVYFPRSDEGDGHEDDQGPSIANASAEPPFAPNDPALTPVIRQERQRQVTVAQDDSGDCRAIGPALLRVAPGGTITVLDSAIYEESLHIRDAEFLEGVHLESPQQATLRSVLSEPVITIDGVPRFRLSGFKLVVPQSQRGIVMQGECPGVVLSDLRIERVSNDDGTEMSNAGVAVRSGSAEGDQEPIQLRRITMRNANVGLVIGPATAADPPVRNVLVEDCRIQGHSRHSSTLLALVRHCEDVVIRHSIFWEGVTGLSFFAEQDASPQRCQFEHNCWFETEGWIAWAGPMPPSPKLAIRNNLLVNASSIAPSARSLSLVRPAVFSNNLAVSANGGARGDEELSRYAVIQNEFPLLSLDPEHSDFLKPDFARLKTLPALPSPLPGVYHTPSN